MSGLRTSLFAMVIGMPVVTTAFAENKSHSHSGAASSINVSSSADAVSNWTRREWRAAKVKWSKEKLKWGSCQRQATGKRLSGRENWSFLYRCMTK
jgi:hypothetical protein